MVFSLRRRQFVLEVFDDGAIEKYGRDDLHEVFLAIKPFSLIKACKWSLLFVSQKADLCTTADPLPPRVEENAHVLCVLHLP